VRWTYWLVNAPDFVHGVALDNFQPLAFVNGAATGGLVLRLLSKILARAYLRVARPHGPVLLHKKAPLLAQRGFLWLKVLRALASLLVVAQHYRPLAGVVVPTDETTGARSHCL
jgi:hypothetical protein